MFQEVIQTTAATDPQTVDKAVQFGAIGMNLLVMALGAIVVMGFYVLRTKDTPVATPVWIKANSWRFIVGCVLLFALAISLVVSPNLVEVMQLIGFSVEKSTFALGGMIGLLIIGATTEPSKKPEG